MTFEDAQDMAMLYSISPEVTCQCDELHECQQCYEERKNDKYLDIAKTTGINFKPLNKTK